MPKRTSDLFSGPTRTSREREVGSEPSLFGLDFREQRLNLRHGELCTRSKARQRGSGLVGRLAISQKAGDPREGSVGYEAQLMIFFDLHDMPHEEDCFAFPEI